MTTLFETARDIAKGAASNALCVAGGLNRVSNDIAGKLNPRYKGSALDRLRDRASDALGGFCPVPGGPLPPPAAPPFSGGQCPVQYRINIQGIQVRLSDCAEVPVSFRTGTVTGPVSSIKLGSPTGALSCDPSKQGFLQIQATTATFTNGNLNQAPGGFRWTEISEIDFERVGGGPDDCGDPPPVGPPGSPPPSDPRPPGTTININLPDVGPVDVTFSPVVGIVYADIDGSIKVPVDIDVNIPAINVNTEFNFDINLSDPTKPPEPIVPRPDKDDDDRPTKPDCPLPGRCDDEPEVDEPNEDDPEEEEEKGLFISGAVVLSNRTVGTIRQTELAQENTPSVFVPYLAMATVVYTTPTGSVVYSKDIPIKRTRQVVLAPIMGLKVVDVRVSWEKGWVGEVLLVRKRVQCS